MKNSCIISSYSFQLEETNQPRKDQLPHGSLCANTIHIASITDLRGPPNGGMAQLSNQGLHRKCVDGTGGPPLSLPDKLCQSGASCPARQCPYPSVLIITPKQRKRGETSVVGAKFLTPPTVSESLPFN